MIALEAKFCNDTGFNYISFLEELQPREPPKFMYEKRLEEIRQTNQKKSLPELNAQKDLEGVLLKVKTKVCYISVFLHHLKLTASERCCNYWHQWCKPLQSLLL